MYYHVDNKHYQLLMLKCIDCKRNTYIGDRCSKHSELTYNVKIRKSQIDKAGLGSFTTGAKFKKGNRLTLKYTGEKIKYSDLDKHYGENVRREYA